MESDTMLVSIYVNKICSVIVRHLISGLHPSRGVKSKIDTRTKSKPAGNKKLTFRAESDSDSEQLPPMSMTEPNGVHNSVYQPQNFAQSHIDDILRENEDLKLKVI